MTLRQGLGFQSHLVDSSKSAIGQAVDTEAVRSKLKSPLIAVLLSAAIPGGGQIYNGSYWKVPIIIGAQAFFVSQWLSNNKSYEYYRTQYSNSISSSSPYGNLNLMGLRDSYRDQRDSYAWYMAGVYLLSMVDAYVDAELSGFEVSPNLSSTPAGTAVALNLRVKF
ncbi:MAG: DUF5683 domain-containing protein [Bacteroidetes bacterium]|nr:DUF5683 domain-containing protein [Bacteroidota bacterium]